MYIKKVTIHASRLVSAKKISQKYPLFSRQKNYGTNNAIIKSAKVWQNKDEEHSCKIPKLRNEKLFYTLLEQTVWQSKEALHQELIFV